MPRRSMSDFPRNEAGLVGEFIGSAYDTVKRVYDNLDEIQRLDDVLDKIPELAQTTVDAALMEALPPFKEEVENIVNSSLQETITNRELAEQAKEASATYAVESKDYAEQSAQASQEATLKVNALYERGMEIILYSEEIAYPEDTAGGKIQEISSLLKSLVNSDDGLNLLSFNQNVEYSPGSLGSKLKTLGVPNLLCAGLFHGWVMGYSRTVSSVEREQIPAGVSHARINFSTGTTVSQASNDSLRIQRTVGNADASAHTVCMGLLARESSAMRGKTVTAHFSAKCGADFIGGPIGFRVQYSVEPEQVISRSDGQYTNGHTEVAVGNFALSQNYPDSPFSLTFDIPEDATQVSFVFIIPFSGVAGSDDSVTIAKGVSAYISPTLSEAIHPNIESLELFTNSRYQTSVPYGSSFGANTTQGAHSVITSNTSVNWAFAEKINFSGRMAYPPRFQFIAPGSGIRSRLLNPATNTFLSGIAFDLSAEGVTVTNNAAPAANTRYLFQWAADCLV